MKAILISIQPKWVVKILNGEKTLEIRKTMPKCDLPIDVYIYCTKGNGIKDFIAMYKHDLATDEIGGYYINGTVVAKFTLNKVEDIFQWDGFEERYFIKSFDESDLLKKSCLSFEEMRNYIHNHSGYAWHIDNLVIFDKPKELSEFATLVKSYKYQKIYDYLTCPPQSWQYIEL